jgi:hypothetical protein
VKEKREPLQTKCVERVQSINQEGIYSNNRTVQVQKRKKGVMMMIDNNDKIKVIFIN